MSLRAAVVPPLQTVSSAVTTGPSTITLNPAKVDPASFLVVTVGSGIAGNAVSSVTDDGGNTWQNISSDLGAGTPGIEQWYAYNAQDVPWQPLNPITAVTVHLAGSAVQTAAIFSEYAGGFVVASISTDPLDLPGVIELTSTSHGAVTGAQVKGPSDTTANRFSELVLGACSLVGTAAAITTPDPMFQDLTTVTASGFALATCDYLMASSIPIGTYHTSGLDLQMAFSLSVTGTGNWAAMMATVLLDDSSHAVGGADFGLGDGGSGIFG